MAGTATHGRRTVRLAIAGRVQGVWYRGWMVERARGLALDGWVRNRQDGSVEAVLSGAAQAVETMIEACHVGPPAALVDDVTVADEPDRPPPGFYQHPSV